MIEFPLINSKRCAMVPQVIQMVVQAERCWQVVTITGIAVEISGRTARRIIREVKRARTFPGDEWRAGVED